MSFRSVKGAFLDEAPLEKCVLGAKRSSSNKLRGNQTSPIFNIQLQGNSYSLQQKRPRAEIIFMPGSLR